MKSQNKTIEDLAKELKMSKSTVSRALRDSYQISEKTRQEVNALAKAWGFEPNLIARGLRINRTFTIGVVVPEIANKYFSTAISGIQDVMFQEGYSLSVKQTNESVEQEYKVIQRLVASSVDGLIISLSGQAGYPEIFHSLLKPDFPVVMFDRICDDVDCSKVIIDHEAAAFNAIEHLIHEGCKRIAYMGGTESLSISKDRIKGTRRALEMYRLPLIPEFFIETGNNLEHTSDLTQWLMQQPNPPDGITCFSDDIAIEVMLALKKMRIPVPKKVKIIGFNNQKDCIIINPNLTSIEHPIFEMGKEAARLLLKHLNNPKQKPQTVIFETKLIIRGSTNNGIKD